MTPFLSRPQAVLLAAACALCVSSLSAMPPAEASTGASKESPYAAATDGGVPSAAPVKQQAKAAGSVAPGTEKESPYAAAKDELALSFAPNLGKLWWLLLPTGLAGASYLYLRGQEAAS